MNGYYIGAMGMLTNQTYINTHANNIANVNTNGYKFEDVLSQVFEHKKAYKRDGEGKDFIGWYENKVISQGSHINLKDGSYSVSNNMLDMAIVDENPDETSFFVISKNGEEYLTRNGEFHLNEERTLKNYSGSYVMDVNGNQITIPDGIEYYLDNNGTLRNQENNEEIAQMQIRVLRGEQREFLEKMSEGKFSYNAEAGGELPLSEAKIETNLIETSNVDISKEMVDLLQSQRRFQASQSIIKSFDTVYEKEANELMR